MIRSVGENVGCAWTTYITCLFRDWERRLEIERIKIKKRERHNKQNVTKIGKNSNFLNALKREQKAKVYIISCEFRERSKVQTTNSK